MIAVLALGFVIGMQHALEADHVAAVSTLVSRERGIKSMLSHGAVWGLGHSVVLIVVGGLAVALGVALEPLFSGLLEAAVGVMLILLGGHLLVRLARDRVHFHRHQHGEHPPHVHAHSHRGDELPHSRSLHRHQHSKGSWWRTLAVGVMHGLAGTAAVVVLTSAAQRTVVDAVIYLCVFGLGSIVGMVALTAVVSVPLALTARALTGMHRSLQLAIGLLTVGVGGVVVWRSVLVL